ncbi:MAG: NADPH-dependent F420 reductase [Bacteroidota bacterium]|nr:NADPH-dependent F420 reductase [uncultured Allomuricauda sp.]
MKLAFIGIGNVGFSLANNLQKKGHEILVAHNDPQSESVQVAVQKNPDFQVLSVQKAITEAEVVFLATPFGANEKLLTALDVKNKVLVDCTNPVGAGISHGLESKISGAEKVQEWAKDAKVVKSYTIYGYENFANTQFPKYNVKPVMLIAGDDTHAKTKVASLNTDLGFETLDVGSLSQSLHLEHMTLLWVKMVRAQGHHPHFTWAYLER